ncbi:nucleoid-associated protein [Flavicella sediminum]|uniref:nucleoid-associated protein n=1 Tax=Flavicella sediminum TaxID=2585141 RepID=UPI00111E9543|nr:nucleoid-associated protein [Flavicella sediminum]
MSINFIEASIEKLVVHKVGNKVADENFVISKKEVILDKETTLLLSHYFLSQFKSAELYRFYHDTELSYNETYSYTSKIFTDPSLLIEQSSNIARHLYNQSTHPKIKGGEFYLVYFKNCVLDGEILDGIGLFKSENKDTFLEVEPIIDGFEIESRKGININKLDKGVLIFNTQKETGFILSIIDNTNRNIEAQYWKDDFLGVEPVKNEFHQTNQFLGITKQFVTKQMTEDFEVTKAEQIDLLNRSVEYFKTNDKFEKNEFEKTVFQNKELIESFQGFDNSYRNTNDIILSDNFDISSQAVKKQIRAFKKVLKLDKNFHIYIHGDKDLIEQGIEKDGRKFYKIYYKDES